MTDPTGAQYDLRILGALRHITRAVAMHSRQLSATSNITAPQLVCLRAIIEAGTLTATALSRMIHVSPSTVVGILDRLEDKGLIRRERGKQDRRIVFVTATEQGVALAEQAPSPLQKKLGASINDLPELEQAAIALALERLVALVDDSLEQGHHSVKEPMVPLLEVPESDVPPESGLLA
jgi:DNA-binding MarR family transcriptional regulator